MRIAQIAPLVERVPPKAYGGTERVVHALTERLVKKGHDVTLFATGDSITSARLISVCPRGIRESGIDDYSKSILTLLNVGIAFKMQDEFDVIHDHNGYTALPTANIAKTPIVTTIHGKITPIKRKMFQILKKPHLVTISEDQRRRIADKRASVVHNGLDMEGYPFSNEHDGYLLFVGRISVEKGVHIAIDAAKRVGLPLVIAAKLDSNPADLRYFKEYVRPLLSRSIRWVGEINEEKRNVLMSRARCFLHPAMWSEPFGLTLIEAMACGCPVVAFNKGAIPELVVHGKTGFVVSGIKSMEKAVQKIGGIDRMACRNHAIKNFSAAKMADKYEKIYRRIA